MLAALTITTFQRAVQRQRPLEGLIHHSDRGSQYAADAFQQCLRTWSVTPSKAAAKLMTFDCIETFNHPRRRRSALTYRSPRDFEKQVFPKNETTNLHNQPKAQTALSKKDQAEGMVRAMPVAVGETVFAAEGSNGVAHGVGAVAGAMVGANALDGDAGPSAEDGWVGGTSGVRTAVAEPGWAFGVAADEPPPLDAAPRDAATRRDLGYGLVEIDDAFAPLGSTERGELGHAVRAHAALVLGWVLFPHPHLSKSPPHEQPIGTSQIADAAWSVAQALFPESCASFMQVPFCQSPACVVFVSRAASHARGAGRGGRVPNFLDASHGMLMVAGHAFPSMNAPAARISKSPRRKPPLHTSEGVRITVFRDLRSRQGRWPFPPQPQGVTRQSAALGR